MDAFWLLDVAIMCLIGSGNEEMLRAIDSPLDEKPPSTVSICCDRF